MMTGLALIAVLGSGQPVRLGAFTAGVAAAGEDGGEGSPLRLANAR